MDYPSLYQMFQEVSTINGSKLAFKHKRKGNWFDVTWAEARETVQRVSKSLIALKIEKGSKASILSQTRLEWVLCDFGIVSCGVVTVGIYHSNLPEGCAYILDHSDSEIVFVEDAEQLAKVLEVRGRLPNLRHIVIYDGPSDPDRGVLSWEDFLDKGADVAEEVVAQRGEELGTEDLASIVYTSGTTGQPKGAMISHGNLVFTSWTAGESLYIEPFFSTLLFLPLAHVFARLIVYVCLRKAVPVAFAESFNTVVQNLQEIRPHFIASVPRVYEKAYDKIVSNAADAGGIKLKLFYWALGIGRKVGELKQKKQPIPGGLALQHRIAHKLVLHKIVEIFGGRMEWSVSGAAPLNKSIAEFFHACGVLILEGIGMTENTSFSHVNRFDNYEFGSVGLLGPEVEHVIATDGELLTRGANTMQGYFKNPEATAETIDQEGWLHTGDIGVIDDEGFLRITDRKKDLIITAGGKNVAPQHIEQVLRTSHYIGQVVAIGDRKKFLSAIITLDPDTVPEWAAQNDLGGLSLEELAVHPKVRELIEMEIEQRNKNLASYESIKKFEILPRDFSIEGGELTPTLKVKRKAVVEKYKDEIESLYEN
jgi:long-chain acyl-CoA synthetase